MRAAARKGDLDVRRDQKGLFHKIGTFERGSSVAKTEWPRGAGMEFHCRLAMNNGDQASALPIPILVCLSLSARRDPRCLGDRRQSSVKQLDCLPRPVMCCSHSCGVFVARRIRWRTVRYAENSGRMTCSGARNFTG